MLTILISLLFVPAVEPYGGCDEAWQAPLSEGAAYCRTLGYEIPTSPGG